MPCRLSPDPFTLGNWPQGGQEIPHLGDDKSLRERIHLAKTSLAPVPGTIATARDGPLNLRTVEDSNGNELADTVIARLHIDIELLAVSGAQPESLTFFIDDIRIFK